MKTAFCILAATLVGLPMSLAAQEHSYGKELFGQYCATCHGTDASGNGPLTEIMLEKPTDLKQLARSNQANPGEFPMLKVIHIIDGRTGLRGHGGSMPTYGEVFMAENIEEREHFGAVLETRGRILSLALYLESLQN